VKSRNTQLNFGIASLFIQLNTKLYGGDTCDTSTWKSCLLYMSQRDVTELVTE